MVFSWNQFLLPLVILSDDANWTLPLGLTNFSTQYTTDTARVLAYTSLALVPALAFYVLAERHLVGGLTSGAVKG
jgi:raffinose/stachyose/melibiose transport system permease protein